jgi:lipopolysaccharide transport system permease protein
MFCSGVFYSVDMLPERVQEYFLMNPMANIIDQYRSVLLSDLPPDWSSVLVISLASLLLLGAGIYFIGINDQKYPRLVIQ